MNATLGSMMRVGGIAMFVLGVFWVGMTNDPLGVVVFLGGTVIAMFGTLSD